MLAAMKREDDIRRDLRNETMRLNQSQLEKQIIATKARKIEEARQYNSYSSGVPCMNVAPEEQKNSYSNAGPDENPKRVGAFS